MLITVPHALCRDTHDQLCDQTSHRRAQELQRTLQSMGHTVVLLAGPVHRSYSDLNRVMGKNYDPTVRRWWEDVDRLGQEADVILDVHSYRGPYFSSTGMRGLVALLHPDAPDLLRRIWRGQYASASRINAIMAKFPRKTVLLEYED